MAAKAGEVSWTMEASPPRNWTGPMTLTFPSLPSNFDKKKKRIGEENAKMQSKIPKIRTFPRFLNYRALLSCSQSKSKIVKTEPISSNIDNFRKTAVMGALGGLA